MPTNNNTAKQYKINIQSSTKSIQKKSIKKDSFRGNL